MATGFGFCSSCGTAIGAAGQRFCATCGAVTAAASAAVPVPPADVPAPPPAPVFVPPVAVPTPPPAYAQPPAWGTPPPPPPAAYGQPQAWGGQPAAPVAAARSGVNPAMFLVGVLVIAAIAVGAFFVVNNPKNSPSASGAMGSTSPGGGGMVFNPSTIGCPSQSFTTNIVLPASVKGTDTLTYKIDTTTIITQTVADFGFEKQANGTWTVSNTNEEGSTHCDMGPGVHTARLLDASGNVLAQGAFTFVMSASPSAAEPTSAPIAKGTVTIDPSKMSCSAASVSVSLNVVLPGSIPADAMISSELDGAIQTTDRTDVGFVKQSDGTWLSTGSADSSTLCTQLGVGDHTIRALDADGNILAEGTFTLQP
jgi:hypothetical protein